MRLIDADAVEKITWEDPHYHDPLNVLTEVREKVRALPTVDAIPVEYIEAEINRMDDDINTAMNDGEPEWAERSITRRTTLQMLVEMWRLKRKEE